ncbi:MAG: ATP-NAD kinase family protein [Desulfurococcaceae archaeon]
MPNKRVGFIVNPIAGMGGSVGLKGTDGEAYLKALERGAKPVSPQRALDFLNNLKSNFFDLVSARDIMGEEVVRMSRHCNKLVQVVGNARYPTSKEDTIEAARAMKDLVDIIVFVGGDGTARDIHEAVGTSIPVVGVPSGVKMYSSVFAVSPIAAASLVGYYLEGKTALVEREVLDIDEDAFRKDCLLVRLWGYLLVPIHENLVQSSKAVYSGEDEDLAREAIAEFIVENMEPGVPYILGPGTTVKAICKKLGLSCTTLGVDVVLNRELIIRDACERDLSELIEKYPRAKIVVTPIGGQGFLFGRGNQQISWRVVSAVNANDIIVVSTERKIRELPYLMVDTGSFHVDSKLCGYIRVLVDYNKYRVMRVISGT